MESEFRSNVIRLLRHEMSLLSRAVKELVKETDPATPMPKPRTFAFVKAGKREKLQTKEVFWPHQTDKGVSWVRVLATTKGVGSSIYGLASPEESDWLAKYMVDAVGGHPAKILRVLRNIRAARVWCEKARERRLLAAKRILRQQEKALKILENEIAALDLSRD